MLAYMIDLENLATQQHILQHNADEIRVGVEMMESFKGWNGHYSMINHNARNKKKTKRGR